MGYAADEDMFDAKARQQIVDRFHGVTASRCQLERMRRAHRRMVFNGEGHVNDNPASSSNQTMRVPLGILGALVACGTAIASTDSYIPAAARTPGANNTFFQTELRIVNLSSATARVDVALLSSNADDSSPLVATVEIPSRSSKQIDDVLPALFGVASGGGALHITSTSDLAITSRTYTSSSSGCPGTYGQFIGAVSKSSATTHSLIPNIRLSASSDSGFRSNVGAVNTTSTTASIALTLRDGTGVALASATMTLLPNSHTQASVSQLFSTSTSNDNLFIELQATQPVIAYASVVDNASADPIFIPATVDTGTPGSSGIVITARQWRFDPATIEVPIGKPVTLLLRALDVDHGIGLSGVGAVSCSSEQGGQCVLHPNETTTVTFTPTTAGSFAFFCTRFCGSTSDGTQGHATMRGTIVVK